MSKRLDIEIDGSEDESEDDYDFDDEEVCDPPTQWDGCDCPDNDCMNCRKLQAGGGRE